MASQFQELFDMEEIPQEKLSNCPWREDFMDRLLNITRKNGLIWCEIANSIDRDETANKKHQEIVFETIDSAFQGLIINATTLYDKHLEIVAKHSEKVENLEMMLEVNPSNYELTDKEMSLVEIKNLQMEKIEKLQKEITKLEQVQQQQPKEEDQNLQAAIESSKQYLEILWDKCQCDSQTRHNFPYIYTTTYTDDIFNIFKKEIQKLEAYFKQHRDILHTIKSYERILREVDELELNSNQTDLYTNRGGLLLTELRKKNLMSSRLKNLEEKLRKQSAYYIQRNKQPFRSFGVSIEDLLEKGSKKKKFLSTAIASSRQKSKILARKSPQSRGTPVDGTKKKVNTPKSDRKQKATTLQKGTPALPKFKLNETRKNPTNKLEWKPSRFSLNVELKFDDDSYASDYSEFEVTK